MLMCYEQNLQLRVICCLVWNEIHWIHWCSLQGQLVSDTWDVSWSARHLQTRSKTKLRLL